MNFKDHIKKKLRTPSKERLNEALEKKTREQSIEFFRKLEPKIVSRLEKAFPEIRNNIKNYVYVSSDDQGSIHINVEELEILYVEYLKNRQSSYFEWRSKDSIDFYSSIYGNINDIVMDLPKYIYDDGYGDFHKVSVDVKVDDNIISIIPNIAWNEPIAESRSHRRSSHRRLNEASKPMTIGETRKYFKDHRKKLADFIIKKIRASDLDSELDDCIEFNGNDQGAIYIFPDRFESYIYSLIKKGTKEYFNSLPNKGGFQYDDGYGDIQNATLKISEMDGGYEGIEIIPDIK